VNAKELSLLPARAALGATMIYHGSTKLRGEGPQQHAPMFEQMGFRPGHRWARLTGIAEVLGGATAILGIGTRLGALAILGTQAVAIAKVHGPKGFSNMAGGFEFNLALAAIALGLLAAGPGAVSGQRLVTRRLERRPWRLLRSRPRAALRAAALLG
jgi:putative oxidoreductase